MTLRRMGSRHPPVHMVYNLIQFKDTKHEISVDIYCLDDNNKIRMVVKSFFDAPPPSYYRQMKIKTLL